MMNDDRFNSILSWIYTPLLTTPPGSLVVNDTTPSHNHVNTGINNSQMTVLKRRFCSSTIHSRIPFHH
jgi:hypothetical protein